MYGHYTYGETEYAGVAFQRQFIDLLVESTSVTESDSDSHMVIKSGGLSDNITDVSTDTHVTITSSIDSSTVTESDLAVKSLIGISGDSIIVTDTNEAVTKVLQNLFGDSVIVTDTLVFDQFRLNAFVGTVEIVPESKYFTNVEEQVQYLKHIKITPIYNVSQSFDKIFKQNVNESNRYKENINIDYAKLK